MLFDTVSLVLIAAISNAIALLISSYFVFIRYKAPIYHLISIYQVYFLFGFVLRPLEIYLSGYSFLWFYVGIVPGNDTLWWVWAVVLVAHFVMLIGFVVANEFKPVRLLEAQSFEPRNPHIFSAIVLFFLLLGTYSSFVQNGSLANTEGILAASSMLDDQGGNRLQDVSGYQTVFEGWIPISLLGLFMWHRARKVAIVLMVAFIAYRTLVGAGRQQFVELALGLILLKLVETRRRFPSFRMMGAAALILLLYNLVGADRLAFRKILAGELSFSQLFDNAAASGQDETLTAYMAEYDTFAAFAAIIPEQTGYSYGTQYARLLIWPIPRAVWHDKPVFTLRFNPLQYGNYIGLTTTLFMDSYMNLGAPVMAIILFLVSYLISILYLKVVRARNPNVTMLYIVIGLLSPILFRDGLVPAAYNFLTCLPPAYILGRTGGRMARYPHVKVASPVGISG